MINLFNIKTFISLSKTNSFRIAAERNAISQPAVSQHIHSLENKLNTILFERRGKKVALTPSGKIFLPYAENIIKQYDEAKTRIREMNNTFRGTIRIATIYSIGLYELKSAIRHFLKKYPDVNLQLEYHQNAAIYEMILNRNIDFGLVAFPQKRKGLVGRVFFEDVLVLVQSPRHRVVPKKNVSFEELKQVKFIGFSTNTPTGRIIHKYFSNKRIHPYILQDYDNIELIKSAVIQGLGCALLPKNTIQRELKDRSMEIIHVKNLDIKRPLGILFPSRKVFTKTTRTFYELLMA